MQLRVDFELPENELRTEMDSKERGNGNNNDSTAFDHTPTANSKGKEPEKQIVGLFGVFTVKGIRPM